MRRRSSALSGLVALVALLPLLVALLAGCGGAPRAAPASTSAAVAVPAERVAGQLSLRSLGRLGQVLVDDTGRTLYARTGETATGPTACPAQCRRTWPLLLAPQGALPATGSGLRVGLLGVVDLPGAARTLTYAGRPLHRYVGDAGPGDASGQGAQQTWFCVTPTGQLASAR